jgi:hypothetical protein
VDWYGLQTAILGPNTNPHATLKVGNVILNLRAGDPGPPNSAPTNAFLADELHPNTTLHGILGNVVLQAFNSGYGAGVAVFSEQEILNHAFLAYGGSDTLQSQIGPYTDYVFLPTLPRFTAINVFGTNVALSFSSVSNQFYLGECRDHLATGSWVTVSSNVPGTGGIVALTNAVSAALPERFYRVRQLP